jgi:HK97 family phage portal protein
MLWPFTRKKEAREGVMVTQSSPEFLQVLGLDAFLETASGDPVTVESALGVPAVFSAVNFLAGTIAGIPRHVYERGEDGTRKRVGGDLWSLLHDVANEEASISAFEFFKWWMEQALTGGRGVAYIERGPDGVLRNLWPLEPGKLTIRRINGVRKYQYRDAGKVVVYDAAEVLDLPFMLKADGFTHRSPIMANREAIAMAQAMTRYGAAFFRNGGVPPFAVTGGFKSGGAMGRAADDLEESVRKAAKEKRVALVLPTGLEIKPIGGDPDKNQMIEAQRFMVEQVARIYSMPPIFLQDLTHGTFSNTEQQDLHFVKHTVKRWVEQIEQELNLKFFGRGSKFFVEFSMDGLLRGDFKTRMDGYAQAIQNAILTPNEVAQLENRPPRPGGNDLLIQGATVPLVSAGKTQEPPQ